MSVSVTEYLANLTGNHPGFVFSLRGDGGMIVHVKDQGTVAFNPKETEVIRMIVRAAWKDGESCGWASS